MFKQTAAVLAIAGGLTCGFGPQLSAAETFKSSEFLKWPLNSQSFYFRTAIGMAGLIASYNDKKHARCIEGWYFDDTPKAEASLRQAMQKFGEYHPRGVILAVLKKACGSFEYKGR